jgi:enoyl-CoA hydratase/carnithine racemase
MPQIRIDKSSPGRWTATFSNPPINLIDLDTIGELQELVSALESDPDVGVVVFRSLDPDFFLAHWDVLVDKAKVAAMPPGPTGMHPWGDVLVRLSRAPVASIAEIRGRARGAGSEFALSCDMRFASDLAPKFYPIPSSLVALGLPGWAVVATGAGAEPSA